jgi:hypothetical protein
LFWCKIFLGNRKIGKYNGHLFTFLAVHVLLTIFFFWDNCFCFELCVVFFNQTG